MRPIISIIIPTKNSARTLKLCLKSIDMQDYPSKYIETIVVDCYSNDDTVKIAQEFNCKIIHSRAKPLGARYIGLQVSKGDIIMFIDADHILARTDLLQDIVNYIKKGYEILHLEEISFKPRTLIQKLIATDRYINQQISKLMPLLYGTLYPRVLKREIALRVFNRIPKHILPYLHEHEDVIVHYEAINITQKHTSVPKALFHVDEESLWRFLRKIAYYGHMDFQVKHIANKYSHAIRCKQLFRIREIPYLLSKYPRAAHLVLLLIILKSLAYKSRMIKH